jgi:uncharacterized membrane protein (UPF0127 family)
MRSIARLAVFSFAFVLVGASARADEVEGLDITTATGAHHYEVEIAKDEAAREHGLMDRHQMPDNHGMLFEFPSRAPVTFWMKDTYIPLDMIFIDSDGTVRNFFENAKPLSEALIPSGIPVVAVLELNGGQARAIHLKPGDKVKAAFFAH